MAPRAGPISEKSNLENRSDIGGTKNRLTVKAAYLLRDTVKALGTQEIQPATAGIFYDDLTKPESGGTGQTMKVCKRNGIPVFNQNTWFDWLKPGKEA